MSDALLLAGTSLFAGSVVFLLAVLLGKGEPATPRAASRLAAKVRVNRVVLVVSVVLVCAAWWLEP
ncbi:hypothetical protein [Nocardia sp. NRRL S-836]|uniref:hypothetical protein n=1 Tax=Nocardia sp. NRRL S-836 TaxID=1519492 RepID=UPI001E506825|nr:hypothetical protein [Nocardia sp. NRRL S-836]